jgi:translation initiation factor 5B
MHSIDKKIDVMNEIYRRFNMLKSNFKKQGFETAFYWENTDPRSCINVVPTSAVTGEGIQELLDIIVNLTKSFMFKRLSSTPEIKCTVLEVSVLEGLGITIDCVLINGLLKEGDHVILAGRRGPITTCIKGLLTPKPNREPSLKNSYLYCTEVKAVTCFKLFAHNLEGVIAGSDLLIKHPSKDLYQIENVETSKTKDINKNIKKSEEGIHVQAPSIGYFEAILDFLRDGNFDVNVNSIGLGPVDKKEVIKCSSISAKKKETPVILAFNVQVNRDAIESSKELGVQILADNVIHRLCDQFNNHREQIKTQQKKEILSETVFPVRMKILANCIFNKKDPIVVGVNVLEGKIHINTPICVFAKEKISIGRIASLEVDHKSVDKVGPVKIVAIKIQSQNKEESQKIVGRHFEIEDELLSDISRHSIELLKKHFCDSMSQEDWALLKKLKRIHKIE